MKTLHLSTIIVLVISIMVTTNVFAQNETSTNTNNVEIQNIQVEPSAIKVGDTLKITATLVNNSPDPIFVSDSGSPDCEGPFFTVMFDNHVKIKNNGMACSYVAFIQRLDPGTKTTGTSPGLALVYTATESGTANATVTFSYSDSGIEKTISKSFQFQIHDVNSDSSGPPIPLPGTLLPLQQFKSGISLEDITCRDGLFLAISNEKNPLCLGPGTISKLASRGLLYGARQDSETTILIPPGSEDPASNKTYSPDVTTVVIGINNTVRWINQSPSAANTIKSDGLGDEYQSAMVLNSSVLMPGQSWEFTFTQPGTYHYHGEPHPWQKGIINVISIPIPANLTSQQPNTTNFPQNKTIFGDFYPGIENYSGIISIKNQTYYMTTASNTTYPIAHGMTVEFHNVTFSFPYGAQATPGGIIIPFDMTFPDGTTETYGNVTKNPDGSGSISGIGLGPGPSSNRTVTVQSGHMHPQAGVTLTEDQVKLLVSTDGNTTITQTPQNHTLPASFEPCQDPYPQNYTGIPVLSMPENSTGKICVRYHNLNDFAAQAGIKVSEADNLTGQATTISTWSDSENNQIPPNQDLTIVYWIKTGDRPGFYGLTMFCAPIPLAVGYGNDSMTASDFPWIGKQFECPMLTYDFHIDSTTGIDVRYIPYRQ